MKNDTDLLHRLRQVSKAEPIPGNQGFRYKDRADTHTLAAIYVRGGVVRRQEDDNEWNIKRPIKVVEIQFTQPAKFGHK
jgi:hypothetical protein